MTATLYNLDALTLLDLLDPGSVDAIITDLPYGTTACSWDEIIPFAPMWAGVKRVLKPRGAFVTTASQPFTSKLIMSNLEWFKYSMIWEKSQGKGFLNAWKQPMRWFEDIAVFYELQCTYNPQITDKPRHNIRPISGRTKLSDCYGKYGLSESRLQNDKSMPSSIIKIINSQEFDHPTQKPVALYSYLIRTYTNPGDTVLDFCMGSGTTGVACVETGRNFIGSDNDTEHGYFEIAKRRIARAELQPVLFRHEERAEQAALL